MYIYTLFCNFASSRADVLKADTKCYPFIESICVCF